MNRSGLVLLGLVVGLLSCSANPPKTEIRIKSDYEAGVSMHERGNIKMAITFFEQGVEKGDPRSMFALASYYHFGDEVERDYTKARELLERSSAIGSAESDAMLGIIYREGQGVESNKQRAVSYLKKADYACSDQAQEILAQMLYDGEGVQQNRVEALAFLHIAAKSESNEKARSGVAYVSRELSSEQISEALVRAKEIEKSITCRT